MAHAQRRLRTLTPMGDDGFAKTCAAVTVVTVSHGMSVMPHDFVSASRQHSDKLFVIFMFHHVRIVGVTFVSRSVILPRARRIHVYNN